MCVEEIGTHPMGEPSPRVSRFNTREKPPTLYTLVYRLSAPTRGTAETRQNKTEQDRGKTAKDNEKKRTKGEKKRKMREQEGGLMDIVHRTFDTGVG